MADIERLERKVDELTDIVKTLSGVVRDIYRKVNNTDTTTSTHKKKLSKDELHDKEIINWRGLLEGVKGSSSESFVLSIYNNEYKTITTKQLDALDAIATEFEVELEK